MKRARSLRRVDRETLKPGQHGKVVIRVGSHSGRGAHGGGSSGNAGCGEKAALLQAGGDRNGEVVGHQDKSRGQGLELNMLTRACSSGNESVVELCGLHV
jgi:hypothetical protein